MTIEGNEKDFFNNTKDNDLNKIRMKFFSWEELVHDNELLFNEINNKIFNTDSVLKVASTYTPQIKYTDKQKKQKYFDALKSIGFISNKGVDISHNTLHGDIGEFLMHIMLSKFLSDKSVKKYIYPKLVFKTSPKMPVYGNDGTIYIEDTKEIFYLEAKFYSDLESAVNEAVKSLKTHNEVCKEDITHRIELFRNIKTDELNEIIEIDENVTENLVLFLICDDYTDYEDILDVIVKCNPKMYQSAVEKCTTL
nr:Hachiman antiphage defense system protein HamA [Arcobacter porcinus]